jgi:hypothetical protein
MRSTKATSTQPPSGSSPRRSGSTAWAFSAPTRIKRSSNTDRPHCGQKTIDDIKSIRNALTHHAPEATQLQYSITLAKWFSALAQSGFGQNPNHKNTTNLGKGNAAVRWLMQTKVGSHSLVYLQGLSPKKDGGKVDDKEGGVIA